ncbi:MAG: pilin [Candidatus Paceibacterota bacterium]|jgi:hypothetical protein
MTTIPGYISTLYQFAVGISGIVAVGMIVIGGIYISVSGSVDKKSEGKDMITQALFGLALLLGSWLILNTINPKLVTNMDIPNPSGILNATSTTISTASICEGNSNASSSTCPRVVSGANLTVPGICTTWEDVSNFLKKGFSRGLYVAPPCTGTAQATKIWRHPYYINDKSGFSVQCVIYAYREQSSSTPIKLPIPDDARPC